MKKTKIKVYYVDFGKERTFIDSHIFEYNGSFASFIYSLKEFNGVYDNTSNLGKFIPITAIKTISEVK